MAKRASFDDPRVKATRHSCFVRDDFKCVICGNNRNLNHHHIHTVATHPQLEFVVSNTVTLCEVCHGTVTGREEHFVEDFKRIVKANEANTHGKNLGKRPKKEFNSIYIPRNPNQRY